MTQFRRIVAAFVVAAASAESALAQNYAEVLQNGSLHRFEVCPSPCTCPPSTGQGALAGTFQVRLLNIGDIFDRYEITNVALRSSFGIRVSNFRGQGQFFHGPLARLQRMELPLVDIDTNQTLTLSSGVVPLTVPLPRVDVTVLTTIEDCTRTSMVIRAAACIADVDDGSGTGTQDGGVTIDDLLYYLQRFARGC